MNFVTNYFYPTNWNPYRCYAVWVNYFGTNINTANSPTNYGYNMTWDNAATACSSLLSGASTVIFKNIQIFI